MGNLGKTGLKLKTSKIITLTGINELWHRLIGNFTLSVHARVCIIWEEGKFYQN